MPEPCLTLEMLQEQEPESTNRFRCPLCESGSKTLGVDLPTGRWHCFKCDAAGVLGEYTAEGHSPPPVAPKRDDWRRLWNESKLIKPGSTWRGINQWGPSRHHRLWYGAPAVVFPSYDWMMQPIGCQGRRIAETIGSRVLTAAGSTLGLFATSVAAFSNDPLIVCEAPLDALSMAGAGYPTMATFGIALPEWINRLTWWRRVAIATDADEAGDRAAERWERQIQCRGFQRLRPQVGKDWNDWLCTDREGMKAYLDCAVWRHPGDAEIYSKR